MTLKKSIGIYSVTNILDKAVPFLMLPVLTHYLSPEDFGTVAMFLVLVSVLFPFIGLNIHGAINRQFIDKDQVDIASYIGNSLYILLVSTLIVGSLVLLSSNLIEKYFLVPKSWLMVVSIITATSMLSEVVLAIYNISHKPIHYGLFKILRTLTIYTFITILVVGFNQGWEGRVHGQFYGELIFSFIALYLLYHAKLLSFTMRPDYIKSTLKFGIPLIPHAFGAVMISLTDRLLITNLVGIEETGIYVVGVQVGVIVSVLIGSIKQAWTPYFFDKLKTDLSISNKEIVKMTYTIILAILCLSMLFSLLVPFFVPYIVSHTFTRSMDYISWIVFAFAIQGIYHLFAGYFFYFRKTHILMILTFSVAIINLIISYFLILENGPVGAAQGTIISYLIITVFTWYMSNNFHPMPWKILKWRSQAT